MAGIAMSSAVASSLAMQGVSVVGHQWLWAPGVKGGIFDPHRARDKYRVFNVEGFVGDNAAQWGALPGQGVNALHCMCTTKWILRDAHGRLVRLEDVMEYSEATRRFAHQDIDGLTEQQLRMLRFYTQDGYFYANYQLRTGNPFWGVRADEMIRNLDEVLSNQRFQQNLILKRFERDGRAFGLDDVSELTGQIGKEFTWRGFTSTTTPKNHSAYFAKMPVEVTIRAPRGTKGAGIARYSNYRSEDEILLARNTRVRVVSVDESKGRYRVTVEVVGQ